MSLGIKDVQFHQLKSLIESSVCDNKCDTCGWKNNGNYNFAEYDCLLKELQSIFPKPQKTSDGHTMLDYLKSKKEVI